jgi:hypothetical protein
MPNPPPGRRPRLAWALLGLTVALVAAAITIGLARGERWNAVFGFIPVALAFTIVGALVVARTGNRLGWLFLITGTLSAVSLVLNNYAARGATAAPPGAAWAGWAFTIILALGGPLYFLTPLLFPDGRLPSSRWRPVVWAAVIGIVVETATSAVSNVNFSSNFRALRDPVTVLAPLNTAYNLATSVQPIVFVLGAIAMIVRFRRAGTEQRQQLKWFMYASVVSAVVVFVAADVSNNPLPAFEIVTPLIPAAVGIAILKYRLYDIDRLISRTLGYAIVTGLLVGLYAGLVLLATQVLEIKSPVAVAASTLAAAALFTPLRRRVQHVVDRRFNRVRYDADQTIAAFAARLQEGAALDAVRSDLLAVVTAAVEPAHLSVWTAPAARRT